jgi:ABC-type branched-subunit amino acid transport system ATPase component
VSDRPDAGQPDRPAGAEQPAGQPGTPAGAERDAGVKAATAASGTHEIARGDRSKHEADAGDALLRADDVTAGYVPGVNILTGCDFYVNDGELVGIIGPNGAGKSTLLKAMFGLVRINRGSVTLRGDDITNLKANRLVAQGVGFVPQTNNVFPSLTIEENLQMGVYQSPRKFKKSFEFVTGLFPALGDRRAQRAGSLSGGERQMVAMGRALMMEPSVLLLDEPSAGLSPALQDEVFVRTRQINRAGVSVIMVEQNARRCLQICDRGYVLDQGRNAYTGSGQDLANDPKVIELYLGTLAKA